MGTLERNTTEIIYRYLKTLKPSPARRGEEAMTPLTRRGPSPENEGAEQRGRNTLIAARGRTRHKLKKASARNLHTDKQGKNGKRSN